MPLRKDQHNDNAAIERAEDAFSHRIARKIVSSPNLLLATYLHRLLAPHLALTLTALVHSGKIGHMHPPRAPAAAGQPRHDTGQPPRERASLPPTPQRPKPAPRAPSPSTAHTVVLEPATQASAQADADPANLPPAPQAASTSALAAFGVVAEGTA